jgi:GT2 family glycosyltransferase
MTLYIPGMASSMGFACRISRQSVLCWGVLEHALGKDDVVSLQGQLAQKPFLGGFVQTDAGTETVCIFTVPHAENLTFLNAVLITGANGTLQWEHKGTRELLQYTREWQDKLSHQSPDTIRKLLFVFYKYLASHPEAALDPIFVPLFYQTRQALDAQDATLPYQEWILPNALYVEADIPLGIQDHTPKLLVTTPKGLAMAPVEWLYFPQDRTETTMRCAGVALFTQDIRQHVDGKSRALLLTRDALLTIPPPQTGSEIHLGRWLTRLRQKDRTSQLLLREHLARALLAHRAQMENDQLRPLLQTLQYLIAPEYTSVVDMNQPFGATLEYALPIGNQGFLCSGWIRDPLHTVKEVTLLSDLGFELAVLPHAIFHRRDYVDALYQNSPFARQQGSWGLVAYVPIPPDIRALIEGVGNLHSVRFQIVTESGLTYSIAPQPHASDPFALRQTVIDQIAPHVMRHPEGEMPVRKALESLQKTCMQQVEVKHLYPIGPLVHQPKLSVVIPLYQCLDYIQAQIAHFSLDPAMQQAEVIYVLDSPEQEETVLQLLKELHALYDFPVTLLVMNRNAGYAAATNAGARQARGTWLLLLNSDVLPIAPGWASAMLEHASALPKLGAMGIRLLYEDDSIQHAGMFSAYDALEECYTNRHYFKGMPPRYPLALQSREVPMVTGACMLLERARFFEVGGLSTDYIVGDFEDSDLCLALRHKGYRCYYMADAVMYHLERQSVPLNSGYRPSVTYRLNAQRHHERWSKTLDSEKAFHAAA